MSGHSKWATIHRQKEINDAKRGQMFGKFSKAITIAAKEGGSDPNTNFKLRMMIDKARGVNMPKTNIDRALASAEQAGSLEEMVYEGYGPGGIAVIVEVTSDNKNRTGQEMKGLFERYGGSLGKPGAVSFNFESKGELIVATDNVEETMLKLIDEGVDDVEEGSGEVIAYVAPQQLGQIKSQIESKGFKVESSELVMKPKQLLLVEDRAVAGRVLNFLDVLEEHDDVQKVFSNFDAPEGESPVG